MIGGVARRENHPSPPIRKLSFQVGRRKFCYPSQHSQLPVVPPLLDRRSFLVFQSKRRLVGSAGRRPAVSL